ncbi:MAG: hypothetical protein EHM61_01075 [Acidobacteria bacterium]|nr:MAG: hypothetical protein EHM61_01075 [Acidobacteriota bacterium]
MIPVHARHGNPELELMLCCARTVLADDVAARRDALLKHELDWARFRHLVSVHRVTPLIQRNLSGAPPGLVPPDVARQLRDDYAEIVRNNLFLAAGLLRILGLFAASGIEAIPYKGPVLAESLYGSLLLRQFGDLDVLVRRREIHRAKELLLRNGFRVEWPEQPLTPAQEQAHIEGKYNYKMVRGDGKLPLELHWGVSPKYVSFPPDPYWLWRNLTDLRIAGHPVCSFTWERWLLVLCVHGANHCWNRLGWLCDVAELLRRFPDLDWKRVDQRARQFGIRRILDLGLLLAHDLLDAPVPADLHARAIGDQTARSLADEVVHRCANTRRYVPAVMEVPRFHLRARERLRDRRLYCRAAVEPSVHDYGVFSLPGPLSFLYYLLRPFRLFREYSLNPLWCGFKRRLGKQRV